MDITQALHTAFPWTPTSQQAEAFGKLRLFLADEAPRTCFVLNGYAGTGKTTLVGALVKVLPRFSRRTVLLAPTGRAAKVMSQYAKKKALTIHKKIYRKDKALTPDMAFSLGNNAHTDTLFIVDEASMISDEVTGFGKNSLLQDLIQYVFSGENCHLMFVGDTAQLPPVGYLQSPALAPQYLAAHFGLQVLEQQLTEVVRQEKTSGILHNATRLRAELQKREGVSYSIKFETRGFKDIFRLSGLRLVEGIHYAYDKYGMENTLVVCRSNRNANLYNQHIRNQILFREEELTGGDYIMVVRNNYFWLADNGYDTAGFIANGDIAQIRRVRNIHEQHGFRFADVSLEFTDVDEIEPITCRVMLDTLHTDAANLPREKQQQLYEAILTDYQDIPNKQERMEKLKSDPYYNALQIKFAMAVTCHKAQGGQWDAVFVDQGYLTDEMVDTEFIRWLYTANTRATKELFLVNFNDDFF